MDNFFAELKRHCALLVAVLCVLVFSARVAAGAPGEGVPNFSPGANIAWQSDTREGLAPSRTGPQAVGVDPVMFDKNHPYDMDTAYPVLDVANPNLQPWVAYALKAQNERVLSGKPLQPKSSSCWPHGLPAFMRYNGPTFIIQSASEVVIIKNQSSEVRRVLLTRRHSLKPKPSWYGESIGHYENGDTLVVDTIGLTDRTYVDLFRTPHSPDLHVIERWKLIEGGREIELKVQVEDPGAFKAPYELTKHYKQAAAQWMEVACAENPIGPLGALRQGLEPIPQADQLDF
jgi:hypothetical protein